MVGSTTGSSSAILVGVESSTQTKPISDYIVAFRWSPSGLWFSTWAFLLGFLAAYVSVCLAADALLLRRRKPVPLGPLPAAHALLMAAVSSAIFAGTLLSAVAEIRDTRWSWRGRSRTTPLRWLLCFPPGTRLSGRVFFWSYAYYLSRYLHALRGAFAVLLAVAFGFRFLWAGMLPAHACQLGLLGCNLACHAGVAWMHFDGPSPAGAAASGHGCSTPCSGCSSTATAAPAPSSATTTTTAPPCSSNSRRRRRCERSGGVR
ncbi:hypothetical protein ZWY2020_034604 [Hordeum vulgare]|nr:hypothetical protein ZWY2020_034604 [Hordeum vulgare]